jgi:hypothetical protein
VFGHRWVVARVLSKEFAIIKAKGNNSTRQGGLETCCESTMLISWHDNVAKIWGFWNVVVARVGAMSTTSRSTRLPGQPEALGSG